MESSNDPPVVAAARVTRETLTAELVLAAEFRPYQEIDLHAKVAGYLKEIRVDVGDRVQAGQFIAVLEIPELADEAAQAAAAKKRSEAELVRARSELERAESAHAATHLGYQRLAAVSKSRPNLIAQQEIDDTLARDRVTEAQVATARAAIGAAEQQVQVAGAAEERVKTMQSYARIVAPFAGVITKRYADTGAMIQAGTASQTQTMPVVRLSQIEWLRLILPVPESAVPKIRRGAPVEVRVRSLGRSITGRVSRFSSRVSTATRTMDTEVDVENATRELVPGMYADAVLMLERRAGALAAPVQAVSAGAAGATVLVIDPHGRLAERAVKLGLETPEKWEITSGVKEGELLAIGKRGRLHPGDLVRPKEVK